MNLASRPNSQPNTPARPPPAHAGSSTALLRGEGSSTGTHQDAEELGRLRELLLPAPIEGLEDWGIPPETSEPCDPALEVRKPFSINMFLPTLY